LLAEPLVDTRSVICVPPEFLGAWLAWGKFTILGSSSDGCDGDEVVVTVGRTSGASDESGLIGAGPSISLGISTLGIPGNVGEGSSPTARERVRIAVVNIMRPRVVLQTTAHGMLPAGRGSGFAVRTARLGRPRGTSDRLEALGRSGLLRSRDAQAGITLHR